MRGSNLEKQGSGGGTGETEAEQEEEEGDLLLRLGLNGSASEVRESMRRSAGAKRWEAETAEAVAAGVETAWEEEGAAPADAALSSCSMDALCLQPR